MSIQGIFKINKYLLPLIFSFLLILPLSLAQPPFEPQVAGGIDILEIRIPQAEFIKQNEDVQLNIHVFNKSTGLQMNNDTIACDVHIFGRTGFHISRLILEWDGEEDFEVTIGGSNFSELGRHSFIINCNSSTIGGFVSSAFDVTETGFNTNPEQILLIVGILLAIVLFILAVIFKDPNIAIASGMTFCIVGIYLFRHGYVGISNFISESVAIIIIGIGSYILFRASIEFLNEADEG